MTLTFPWRSAAGLRWWGVVALVFAAQLGLIFWLSRTGPPAPKRPTQPPLGMRLLVVAPEKLTVLADPTLFALPHRQSFSGPAWMVRPPPEQSHFVWSEPARPLEFGMARADLTFPLPGWTNQFTLVQVLADTPAELSWPEATPAPPAPRGSTWVVLGDLASRRLVGTLSPTTIISDESLTNTVVELVVDAQGWPVAAKLLPPGSGSKAADQEALNLASNARFEPTQATSGPGTTGSLCWGKLIFSWATRSKDAANREAGK